MAKCEQKFFVCEQCGNIIGLIKNAGVPVVCCGTEMKELVANTTDAAQEKHVPVVTVEGGKVTVQIGSVLHPMIEAHYIEWIYLKTENGGQRKCLEAGQTPIVTFLTDEKPLEVYEYCNLHGLWSAKI